jgi:hypothetical protein
MKFVSLKPSSRDNKRYKIIFSEPKKTIHFGAKNGSTYIDHHDKIKRENYLKRHIVNEDWNSINAGSLSAILLWGKSTNLNNNLNEYLRKFKISR